MSDTVFRCLIRSENYKTLKDVKLNKIHYKGSANNIYLSMISNLNTKHFYDKSHDFIFPKQVVNFPYKTSSVSEEGIFVLDIGDGEMKCKFFYQRDCEREPDVCS